MGRTKFGEEVHKKLVEYAKEEYRSKGFHLTPDHRLPNGREVDLYAKREDKEVGVECVVKLYQYYIDERVEEIGDYFDEVVFVTTREARDEEFDLDEDVKILISNLSAKKHTIKVKDDTYKSLFRLKRIFELEHEKKFSMDDIIVYLLRKIPKTKIYWEREGEGEEPPRKP